jgi:hypothetical protein
MSPSAPNRREFLQAAAATALVPLLVSSSVAASPARRPWKWAPEPGLWETQYGDDIVAQLHAAADAGFAAFADPQLIDRASAQRVSIATTVRQLNLLLGPVLMSPRTWHRSHDAMIDAHRILHSGWRSEIDATPRRIRDIAATKGRQRVIDSLQRLMVRLPQLDHEADPSTPLRPWLVEPWAHAPSDQNWYEAFADIVHEVNHPQCRLSVDAYRLAGAGIDVVDYMQRHAAIIGHVELADYPGGFEPGSGTLDIAGIVAATALSPHDGVIGLRCGLSRPGQAGLDRLIAAARHHGGLREEFLA